MQMFPALLKRLRDKLTKTIRRIQTIRYKDGRWFIYRVETRYWDAYNRKMYQTLAEIPWAIRDAEHYSIFEYHGIRTSKSVFRIFDNSTHGRKGGKTLSTKDEPRVLVNKSLTNFYLPGFDFHEYIKNLDSDINLLLALESSDVYDHTPNHSMEYSNMAVLSFTDKKEAAMFKLQFC